MTGKQHITLAKLQQIIKSRLEDAMPLPCWITAEISELKVNYSGHCYLELVEKGGANQVPKAKAPAVIWRSTFGAVASYFKSATGSELAVGMNVLMKVSVSYHELYGLSLVVSDIDPLYTLGDMERQRQMTIERLQQEGVWDMNRELGLPPVVQRIAVVSSRNAAGYQDFMNELGGSPYGFAVTLFDSFMQGHGAEDSLIEALERIAEDVERFDAVVVIRGGGSQSDLAAFDSYRLCSHIAQFPLPVVTGIGHDKDTSVADLVAAVSLKTPTAVAGWLVAGMEQVDQWLLSARDEVAAHTEAVLSGAKQTVHRAALSLSGTVAGLTRSLENRLHKLAGAVDAGRRAVVSDRRARLGTLHGELRHSVDMILMRERSRLELAGRMTAGRTPEKILSLGFAIVRKDGKAVTQAGALGVSDRLEITLSEGAVSAEVKEVKKSN